MGEAVREKSVIGKLSMTNHWLFIKFIKIFHWKTFVLTIQYSKLHYLAFLLPPNYSYVAIYRDRFRGLTGTDFD